MFLMLTCETSAGSGLLLVLAFLYPYAEPWHSDAAFLSWDCAPRVAMAQMTLLISCSLNARTSASRHASEMAVTTVTCVPVTV